MLSSLGKVNCKVLITDMLNNRVIGFMSLLGVLASLKRYYLLKVSQGKWVYTIYKHGGSPLIFLITNGSR